MHKSIAEFFVARALHSALLKYSSHGTTPTLDSMKRSPFNYVSVAQKEEVIEFFCQILKGDLKERERMIDLLFHVLELAQGDHGDEILNATQNVLVLLSAFGVALSGRNLTHLIAKGANFSNLIAHDTVFRNADLSESRARFCYFGHEFSQRIDQGHIPYCQYPERTFKVMGCSSSERVITIGEHRTGERTLRVFGAPGTLPVFEISGRSGKQRKSEVKFLPDGQQLIDAWISSDGKHLVIKASNRDGDQLILRDRDGYPTGKEFLIDKKIEKGEFFKNSNGKEKFRYHVNNSSGGYLTYECDLIAFERPTEPSKSSSFSEEESQLEAVGTAWGRSRYKSGGCTCMTFTDDKKHVVVGDKWGNVALFSNKSKPVCMARLSDQEITTIYCSSLEKGYLLAGTKDGTILQWDFKDNITEKFFEKFPHEVHDMCFHPQNPNTLLLVSDSKAWEWNLSERAHKSPEERSENPVVKEILEESRPWVEKKRAAEKALSAFSEEALAFIGRVGAQGPENADLIKSYLDAVYKAGMKDTDDLQIRSREDGKLTINPLGRTGQTLQGHLRAVSQVVISEDSQYVVSRGEEGTICVWKLIEGRYLLYHRLAPCPYFFHHPVRRD